MNMPKFARFRFEIKIKNFLITTLTIIILAKCMSGCFQLNLSTPSNLYLIRKLVSKTKFGSKRRKCFYHYHPLHIETFLNMSNSIEGRHVNNSGTN